jgi:hypothetical protein
MMDANAFLKRMLLVVAISALSLANVVDAHGGHGSGGSSGGSGSSGSSGGGGHSSSSTGGGHSSSSTSGGHSASVSGHSASASTVGHSAPDPSNVSQSPATTGHTVHEARIHVFVQPGRSTGYNSQNTAANNEDWQRKHHHLLFGFIRY